MFPRIGLDELCLVSLTFTDRIGQHRIRRHDTRRHHQRLEKAQIGNNRPDQQPHHQPSHQHDGKQDHKQREPLFPDILFRQIGTVEKDLDTDNDARQMKRKGEQCMLIMIKPFVWID